MYLIYFQNEYGVWEVFLPNNADGSSPIPHGSRVKVHFSCLVSYFWLKRLRASPNLIDVCFDHVQVRMDTPSGIKDSIPAWIKYSVQPPGEIPYDGIYYDPPEEVFISHILDL